MATAEQVVSAGLKSLIVLGAEAELEAADAQDFIFAMNNYMFMLAADGINLGYTAVSDLSDEITVPLGALQGVIANVAIKVAPQYGKQASAELAQMAREGLKVMEQLGITIVPSRFPGTLPVGAGNEGGFSGFRTNHFYADQEAQILAEVSGAIGLEVDTVEA